MKRNLCFYAYINLDNIPDYVYQHLYLLEKYKNVFDGERIIYIATDEDITEENAHKLKLHFDFFDRFNMMIVKNHPENRESEYFLQQLEDIYKSSKEDSITFYAHTKGSTYDNNEYVLKWLTAMYFFNLEEINLLKVKYNFNKGKLFSGVFRINYPCEPWIKVNWHYSGTFFWINTKALFSLPDWRNHETGRFSVESYPGRKFDISLSSESEILFNNYTQSILPEGYNRFDLRYFAYWVMAFNNNLLPQKRINDFNKIIDELKILTLKKTLSQNPTAWSGHFEFATKLVESLNPEVTVELGVDYGYSIFAFAYHNIGKVYGIDWFMGDEQTGQRNTYDTLMELVEEVREKYKINNIEIIKGDFDDVAKTWNKKINILHIDGLHKYESVKNDYQVWSKFLDDDGVILFHDVECFDDVKRLFDELEGYKIIRSGSCGLGIFTKSYKTYEKIKFI